MGYTLSCCVAEVFGDLGRVEKGGRAVARVTLRRPVHLLDLRGDGAIGAGTFATIAKDPNRTFTQEWSRFFYDEHALFGLVDGLLYLNAHNEENAIAFYERAEDALVCDPRDVISLDDHRLDVELDSIANRLILDI